MAHNDVYIKFLIEYDKAGETASYPALTEYEIATFLDKAYNALLAQKVTGNNYRRSAIETDIKSIADLDPLIKSANVNLTTATDVAPNVASGNVPSNMLYFMNGLASYEPEGDEIASYTNTYDPKDGVTGRRSPVKLVDHNMAQSFLSTSSNIPWIKTPVCFIESNKFYIAYDPLNKIKIGDGAFRVTYISKPNTFVKDIHNERAVAATNNGGYCSYFSYKLNDNEDDETTKFDSTNISFKDAYTFECNDTVAEELISLAVAFALENVESSRLNAKLNMRGLEA